MVKTDFILKKYMREVAISMKKLNEVYKRSNVEFDLIVENTQNELSNENTVVTVIEESVRDNKKVLKKVISFIRVEEFNKWIDSQYPIL